MNNELQRELRNHGSVLPRLLPCPFCNAPVPAWPPLEHEFTADRLPAMAWLSCPACQRGLSAEGIPLRGGSVVPDRQSRLGCTVGLCGLIGLSASYAWAPWAGWLMGLAAVPAGWLAMGWLQELSLHEAIRRGKVRHRAWLKEVGAGDLGLGHHLYECDADVRALLRQIRDRERQLPALLSAVGKLQESSFRDRAALYRRAIDQLHAQVYEREDLLRRYVDYRRDLEALVEASRAEAILDLGEPLVDQDELETHRTRLRDAYDHLLAAAAVADELGALGIGPVPSEGE